MSKTPKSKPAFTNLMPDWAIGDVLHRVTARNILEEGTEAEKPCRHCVDEEIHCIMAVRSKRCAFCTAMGRPISRCGGVPASTPASSTPVVKPAPKQQRPRAGPRTRSRSPVAGAGEATARTRSPPPLTLPAPLPTPAAVSPPALQTFTATDMMNIGVRFASLDQQAATFRDGLADLRASVTASMEQLNAAINEIREPVDRLALSLRPLLKTSSRFAG